MKIALGAQFSSNNVGLSRGQWPGHPNVAEVIVLVLARKIDDDCAANQLTLAELLLAPARGGRLEEV